MKLTRELIRWPDDPKADQNADQICQQEAKWVYSMTPLDWRNFFQIEDSSQELLRKRLFIDYL